MHVFIVCRFHRSVARYCSLLWFVCADSVSSDANGVVFFFYRLRLCVRDVAATTLRSVARWAPVTQRRCVVPGPRRSVARWSITESLQRCRQAGATDRCCWTSSPSQAPAATMQRR
jgi:hypothetical protein